MKGKILLICAVLVITLLTACISLKEQMKVREPVPDTSQVCKEIIPDTVMGARFIPCCSVEWKNGWNFDVLTTFSSMAYYQTGRGVGDFHGGQYTGENVKFSYANLPAVKKIVNTDKQGNIIDATWYLYNVNLVIDTNKIVRTEKYMGADVYYYPVVNATCTLVEKKKE